MKLLPILGVSVAGVFAGAALMEIIQRTRPNLFRDLGRKTKEAFRTVKKAFNEGYTGQPATKSRSGSGD